MSPFHLTRVFRELTGRTLTPTCTICGCARPSTASARRSLSRLAADLGYCSPSHFTDRFRGAFGMPPSQLRNLMEADAAGSS